jgi:general L-amino acid transport system permease protein
MAVDNDYPHEPFTIGKLWTDKHYRGILIQIVTLVVVLTVIGIMVRNVQANFEELGKTFSFSFLWDLPASYDINQCFFAYDKSMPHFYAAACGALNTLAVAIIGCVCATIIGFIFGVLRLSSNWLVNRIAYWYLEFMRNVPVLLHILFWWGAVVNLAPSVRPLLNDLRESGEVPGSFFITNRGFIMPRPLFEDGFGIVMLAVLVAVVAIIFLARWAAKRQEATGEQFPVFLTSLGIFFGLPLLTFFAMGSPLSFEYPEVGRFNFQGGTSISPEMFALTFALTIYTSAFIGEIVRAGIQAINKGQWEASGALGLSRGQTLRKVVIPQAMRVIVPPLTSQYLNLTKNSSLAIAVGYMDIVATLGGITLMQTGKEMETIMLLMVFYLTISLTISLFMNWYNRAIALKER